MYKMLRTTADGTLLTRLLNLPGIVVENFCETETELILEVEAWTEKAVYPRCNYVSCHLHQNHGYWVRGLPISIRQVRLRVNRRQFIPIPHEDAPK